jgi:hypothetical protein
MQSSRKLIYGHWKDDEECPELKGSRDRKGSHGTMLATASQPRSSRPSFLIDIVLDMVQGS